MRILLTPFKKGYLLCEFLFIAVFKLLPDRIRVRIKSKIEIVGRMDYAPHDIYLSINSEIEHMTRRNSCRKEPETVEWIETYFREGDVFFDIGANVGAYSLVASKFLCGNIKVYAFEPGYASYAQLCRNIQLNNCQDVIIPLQLALSNQTRLQVFNYSNVIPGGALHALGPPVDYKGDIFKPVAQQMVMTYRIDDFIPQFQTSVPNHLKIDVDGIEFQILLGAHDTLQKPEVKSLIMELEEGRGEVKTVIDFLAVLNFGLVAKFHQQDQVYNYIFLKNHQPAI